jgi:hypothetical protein
MGKGGSPLSLARALLSSFIHSFVAMNDVLCLVEPKRLGALATMLHTIVGGTRLRVDSCIY